MSFQCGSWARFFMFSKKETFKPEASFHHAKSIVSYGLRKLLYVTVSKTFCVLVLLYPVMLQTQLVW